MSKLKCFEKSCKHNKYTICDKQSIVLDEDAICCSYQKKVLESLFEEYANEKNPEYGDVETDIKCNEETCYYNKDNCCKASEVKIDSDTWCETYRRK